MYEFEIKIPPFEQEQNNVIFRAEESSQSWQCLETVHASNFLYFRLLKQDQSFKVRSERRICICKMKHVDKTKSHSFVFDTQFKHSWQVTDLISELQCSFTSYGCCSADCFLHLKLHMKVMQQL